LLLLSFLLFIQYYLILFNMFILPTPRALPLAGVDGVPFRTNASMSVFADQGRMCELFPSSPLRASLRSSGCSNSKRVGLVTIGSLMAKKAHRAGGGLKCIYPLFLHVNAAKMKKTQKTAFRSEPMVRAALLLLLLVHKQTDKRYT
jgi:hypothetical protein